MSEAIIFLSSLWSWHLWWEDWMVLFELSPKELILHLALSHAHFCLHLFLGVGRDKSVHILLWEFWAVPMSNRTEMQLLADCYKLYIVILITAWGRLSSESSWAWRQPHISPPAWCQELSGCPLGLVQDLGICRSDTQRLCSTGQVWEGVTLDRDVWNGLVVWTTQCSGLSVLSGS